MPAVPGGCLLTSLQSPCLTDFTTSSLLIPLQTAAKKEECTPSGAPNLDSSDFFVSGLWHLSDRGSRLPECLAACRTALPFASASSLPLPPHLPWTRHALLLRTPNPQAIFVTTLAEAPGLLLAALLIDVKGRKWTLWAGLLLSGAALGSLVLDPPRAAQLAMLFVARASIEGTFSVLYVYSPEVRWLGSGASEDCRGHNSLIQGAQLFDALVPHPTPTSTPHPRVRSCTRPLCGPWGWPCATPSADSGASWRRTPRWVGRGWWGEGGGLVVRVPSLSLDCSSLLYILTTVLRPVGPPHLAGCPGSWWAHARLCHAARRAVRRRCPLRVPAPI